MKLEVILTTSVGSKVASEPNVSFNSDFVTQKQ